MRGISSWLILVFAALPAAAGVGLLLDNGDLIEGQEVVREAGQYLLRVDGQRVAIPVELVKEVRLTSDPRRSAPAPRPATVEEDPLPPLPPARQEELSPDPSAPADTPPPREQERPLGPLEVFGEPSIEFPKELIDSRWLPDSDWDPERGSDEDGRSRWNRPPIDARWLPDEGFSAELGAMRAPMSRWSRGRSSRWAPEDGFPKGRTP